MRLAYHRRSRSFRDRARALVVCLLATTASATTWVDVEVTCPVCGTVNVFRAPGSYGGYIYEAPSRFQYVFWPATTDKFLYTCKRCHLTAYMGDFEEIPAEKVPSLSKMLDASAAIEGPVLPYDEIPMAVRLPIAERVYEILERDGEFWCEFRRIEGYHLEAAGEVEKAREARAEALDLASKLLDGASTRRKETLFIAGSMRFFTGDSAGAERDLREAEGLTYRSPELGEETSTGVDRYLGELIRSFRREFLRHTPL